MAVAWPSIVNQTILHDGYNKTIQANVVRTDIEGGPAVYRRRVSRMPLQHTIKLRLNRVTPVLGALTELDVFEQFVLNVLLAGTLTTQFMLPPTYTPKEVRFVFTGTPYTITAYFGDYAYVQFTLEEILV